MKFPTITKSMVAPIIAVLALFVKSVFNIEIPTDVQAQIVTYIVGGIALVTAVVGIVKSHKKEVKVNDVQNN